MNLAVSNRRPVSAAVRCLPQPSADRAKIIFKRAFDYARRSDRAAAAIGSQVAPAQRTEEARVIAGWRLTAVLVERDDFTARDLLGHCRIAEGQE